MSKIMKFILLIAITGIMFFSGCKTMDKSFKKEIIKELMSFNPDEHEAEFNEQIYQIKEASSGGFVDAVSGYKRE